MPTARQSCRESVTPRQIYTVRHSTSTRCTLRAPESDPNGRAGGSLNAQHHRHRKAEAEWRRDLQLRQTLLPTRSRPRLPLSTRSCTKPRQAAPSHAKPEVRMPQPACRRLAGTIAGDQNRRLHSCSATVWEAKHLQLPVPQQLLVQDRTRAALRPCCRASGCHASGRPSCCLRLAAHGDLTPKAYHLLCAAQSWDSKAR